MENAAGDLRRALGGPILGRQLLELTRHAVEEFAELDVHNLILWPFAPVRFVFELNDTEGEDLPTRVERPFMIRGDIPHGLYATY